jgi:uncharacterized protein (DUF433 family)
LEWFPGVTKKQVDEVLEFTYQELIVNEIKLLKLGDYLELAFD